MQTHRRRTGLLLDLCLQRLLSGDGHGGGLYRVSDHRKG